jgi:hypothetical protein
MKQIINRKMYDTEISTCVASDDYFDGINRHRNFRNNFLYLTKNGAFFRYRKTLWQGELDYIERLNKEQAKDLYETLPEHYLTWKESFNEEIELA